MDNRLGLLASKRPSHLRKQDLPDVAVAITTATRGYPVQVGPTSYQGIRVMCFRSVWFETYILEEDWAKIDPYVRSDYFSPTVYPVYAGYELSDPSVQFSPSLVTQDPLYKRVLDVLTMLFPVSYPTSEY